MSVIKRSHVIAEGGPFALHVTDVQLSAAQVLALNATPIELVGAPGANKALIFEGAVIHKPAGTAYAGVAGGEDLSIKYTDASGVEVGVAEMTGFADQATAQMRYVRPIDGRGAVTAGAPSSIAPAANAPLVAHMLVGEITTGDSPINLRIYHRVVDTVLS